MSIQSYPDTRPDRDAAVVDTPAEARPLWNPYIAGIALGVVLLATYLLLGWGLGSSSAPTRLGVALVHPIAPAAVEANAYLGQYVAGGANPLDDWMVFEVFGVFLGGVTGAYASGRMRRGLAVDRGPRASAGARLWMALGGGVVLGFAARLARGCTSGQALTGGTVLAAGSWAFMLMVFAGAYAAAPFLRRMWK